MNTIQAISCWHLFLLCFNVACHQHLGSHDEESAARSQMVRVM